MEFAIFRPLSYFKDSSPTETEGADGSAGRFGQPILLHIVAQSPLICTNSSGNALAFPEILVIADLAIAASGEDFPFISPPC